MRPTATFEEFNYGIVAQQSNYMAIITHLHSHHLHQWGNSMDPGTGE